MPQSAVYTEPVTIAASSDARNITTLAIWTSGNVLREQVTNAVVTSNSEKYIMTSEEAKDFGAVEDRLAPRPQG